MIFGIPLLIFQQAWNITRGIYAKYHYKSCYLNIYSNYIGYTKRLCRWPVVRAWQNGHTRTLFPILHTSSVPGARPEADTFLSCPQCGELSINCYIFRPFFLLYFVFWSWLAELWICDIWRWFTCTLIPLWSESFFPVSLSLCVGLCLQRWRALLHRHASGF